MLDTLPTAVRHSLIALAGALLGWAATEVSSLPTPVSLIAGTAISIATLYLTPLTRQYGVGVDKLPDEIEDIWNVD